MGVSAPAAQKVSDPIQALFVEKIRDYANKKSATGGKMVDATKETETQLRTELEKVNQNFSENIFKS